MKQLFVFFLLLPFQLLAQFGQKDFELLKILEGRWKMETRSGALIEQWTIMDDSTMTCVSYRVSGRDTIPQETVLLKVSRGNIIYAPTVHNQNQGKPIQFALMSKTKGKYLFQNLMHDFPKQILYEPGHKKLKVTLSGGGEEVRFEFKKEN
ncbi:MAG: DUF6265 family protein [Flavisolibacter sp.]